MGEDEGMAPKLDLGTDEIVKVRKAGNETWP